MDGAVGGVVIWHNPRCGTSRRVLAALHEAGIVPEVVEYLQTPPTREALLSVLARAGLRPADLLRRKEPLAKELLGQGADDERILAAMLAHPVLIERPVVITATGAALCRPVERLAELLSPLGGAPVR